MPDRIHKEVEDLLGRLDRFPPPKPWHVRFRDSIANAIVGVFDAFASIPFPKLSAGHVLLISILVIVVGFLVLGSGGFAKWIIVGAVLTFIGAFALSLRRQSRPSQQRYWRDRPMDLDSRSDRPGRGPRRGPR